MESTENQQDQLQEKEIRDEHEAWLNDLEGLAVEAIATDNWHHFYTHIFTFQEEHGLDTEFHQAAQSATFADVSPAHQHILYYLVTSRLVLIDLLAKITIRPHSYWRHQLDEELIKMQPDKNRLKKIIQLLDEDVHATKTKKLPVLPG